MLLSAKEEAARERQQLEEQYKKHEEDRARNAALKR